MVFSTFPTLAPSPFVAPPSSQPSKLNREFQHPFSPHSQLVTDPPVFLFFSSILAILTYSKFSLPLCGPLLDTSVWPANSFPASSTSLVLAPNCTS
jgi:hypothetical protein